MPESVVKLPSFRYLAKSQSSRSPKPHHFSLIDLGSDTIKIAVVQLRSGQVEVLGHTLATTDGQDVAGGRAQGAALAAKVNGALKEAEDATEAKVGQKVVPDNVLFILPGRTVAGKLFTVAQRRPNANQAVTQREIDTLWERVVRLARQGLQNMPGVGPDWVPQAITYAGLWLDNHRVNDPVGLTGHMLKLSAYGVISQPAILRGITQLAERLELDIYQAVPSAQALATIVPARDALVFDVGASGTDIHLVQQDVLVASGRSFMGGNFFTRGLHKAFNSTGEAAEDLKLAFSSGGVLSAEDAALVERALTPIINQWAAMVGDIIADFLDDDDSILPHQLYFVGGGAVLPGLKSGLLAGLKRANLKFDRALETAYLGQTPISGFSYAPLGFRGMLMAPVLSLGKTV